MYQDSFTYAHLPATEALPEVRFVGSGDFIDHTPMNAVSYLLDKHMLNGNSERVCLRSFGKTFTYREVFEKSNQLAHYLIQEMGLKSGQRVLLRGYNHPWMVISWFAVIKAGGIVVATMPLLRAKELKTIVEFAQIRHALCQFSLREEWENTPKLEASAWAYFDGGTLETLENQILKYPTSFENYQANATDVAIIGFTSGTTGIPKMTAHYHRDLVNICMGFPKFSLHPTADDIFTGSPPLGFTFGLGGLVLFPFYYGASSFLIEKPSPEVLLQVIQNEKITICFTAPTAWRHVAAKVQDFDIKSLRKCVSAGETLPVKVWEDWHEKTGLQLIDGIGATEMLHIFIASNEDYMKPGSTGVVVNGYEAKIIRPDGSDAEVGEMGRLAVRGITGCKYLNRPEKQAEYVQNGWNITGDVFVKDAEGFYTYVSRNDDLIISSGYNIAAVEVEGILLQHEAVLECAVVGEPDEDRGMIVVAHIVLKPHIPAVETLAKEIQNWFKQQAAPYKYPRKIVFCPQLPKTETGKIQRFRLKAI